MEEYGDNLSTKFRSSKPR